MAFVTTENLCRYFTLGPNRIRAVDDVSLGIERGEFVALVGSSGSGKSTLLNLLAGLDTPTSGRILVDSVALNQLSRRELARYRSQQVGMIFQAFNLLGYHTALANVMMSLYFDGTPRSERSARATDMLTRVGLAERLEHKPADLSGGEQQRVAIARALVKQPTLLFADEPTGNLDEANSRQVMTLLADLNAQGLTIVLVTHAMDLAHRYARRIVRLHYGKLVEEATSGDETEPVS